MKKLQTRGVTKPCETQPSLGYSKRLTFHENLNYQTRPGWGRVKAFYSGWFQDFFVL
ncbi:hypothetical protein SAMN05421790_11195 [Kroppenstedtia eburnea]|uniref:Uncharacterized protein n=1 Tax=Kroppenstedtia eburnea TaxID=714067 RepID=A0A1N7P643_9BACL|nr:hypothetical protein SAMN05421790_11195 [Kroppenstedtia eburnea]